MNLVADEGVEYAIVQQLRADGHQVVYFAEAEPSSPDSRVLESANRQGALLLTSDKDFGELVFRQRKVHAGVLLLRIAGLTEKTKASLVSKVLTEKEDQLRGAFAVLTPGTLRIRSA